MTYVSKYEHAEVVMENVTAEITDIVRNQHDAADGKSVANPLASLLSGRRESLCMRSTG